MSQPAWIHRIQRGDILRSGSGVLRIVRYVSHSWIASGVSVPHFRTNVAFTIRHCSWTHRCYTILTGNDLVQMGYQPTRGRVKLRKRIDRQIDWEISSNPSPAEIKLTCCDVEGIG